MSLGGSGVSIGGFRILRAVYFHFVGVFDFSLQVCFGLNPPTSGRGLVSWIADHVRESPHQNPGWLGHYRG